MTQATKTAAQIKSSVSLDKNIITLTIPGLDSIHFHMDRINPVVREEAALYGMTVRLTRLAALDKGASWAEKRAAIMAGITHYESGAAEWNLPRGDRETGAQLESDVLAALCRVYDKSPEWAGRQLEARMAKTGADRKAAVAEFAKADKIAPVIIQLRAERAAAKAGPISADDMLADLD
jgi:hypothetical protein